jgi:hypothetical protein
VLIDGMRPPASPLLVASGGGGGGGSFAITGTSGTLSHGSSVTISGAQFGTKAAQSPWKWDDMNGSNGQELDARGWLVGTNTPRPVLSTSTELRSTPSRTSSAFLHQTGAGVPGFSFGDNGQDYLTLTAGSAVNLRTPPTGFVLIDYWMYFVDSTVSNNYKILRWHSYNNPATENRYFGFPGGAGSTDSSTWTFFSEFGAVDMDSQWLHQQIWLRWSDVQDQCYYKHAANGRVWMDSDDAGNYVAQDVGLTEGPWPELPSGDRLSTVQFEHQDGTAGSPTRDGHMTLCDIAIDDGVGAVYLGENAVYANCTHTEYQPYTAWSTSSITVTLNKGTFSSGSAYLFVQTNGRAVTAGFPITLV